MLHVFVRSQPTVSSSTNPLQNRTHLAKSELEHVKRKSLAKSPFSMINMVLIYFIQSFDNKSVNSRTLCIIKSFSPVWEYLTFLEGYKLVFRI